MSSGGPDSPSRHTIAARFERLPYTSYQARLTFILATCFAIDAVDLSMLSFLLAPVSNDLGLTPFEAGIAASSVFVGVAIGATAAGMLCDRYGRRRILIYTMYLWGAASLLTAFAWDLWSFSFLRFITGIGLGAELPAAFALVAECMPASRRASTTGWMQIAASTATVLFNLLALGAVYFLGEAFGWRAMFVFMFGAALFALYVRRAMPESPRWLESQGQHDEADREMILFEQRAAEAHGAPLPAPAALAAPSPPPSAPSSNQLSALFAKGHANRTLFAWGLWIAVMMGFYGIQMWVGKLLVDRGMSVSDSIAIGVLISLAGIPAAWLTGQTLERVGRKLVIIGVLAFVSIAAFIYGHADTFLLVALTGAILRFFMVSLATSLYAYTPELFPTHARATGLGTASTMGRISAIAGPMLVPPLVMLWGYTGAFVAFAACFGVSALLVALFGPETKGRSVEDAAGRA